MFHYVSLPFYLFVFVFDYMMIMYYTWDQTITQVVMHNTRENGKNQDMFVQAYSLMLYI